MQRKLPPFKALIVFEALSRHGSKSLAARELNVTPAAVSKQLRQLEEWIGEALLEEKGLTPQGRVLAQSLSAGLDTISAGIASLRPPDTGSEVALLAPATLALRWLMPNLPVLGADTSARLILRPTHTGEDWLALPHDIVLRRDSWVPQGYRSEALGVERLTIAVAPSLVADGETPAALVHRLPQLRASTRHGDAERWLRRADASHTLGHPAVEFGHLYIAYEAALAGQGWVLAPLLALTADMARGHLVMPFPDIIIEGPRLALLSRTERHEQEHTAPVRAWLRSQLSVSSSAAA